MGRTSFLACLLLGSAPIPGASLTVAAAADISAAGSDLEAAFTHAHPGETVRFVFAASGALAQQIANGAPYDVFLSANEAFVDRLASNRKYSPIPIPSMPRAGSESFTETPRPQVSMT